MFSTRKFACGINRPSGIILVTPPPDGVEIFQSKTDGIENLVAIRASRILAMQFRALAQRQILDGLLILLFESWNVRRRRWHLFAEHLFEHPHARSEER